ncbi:MAG: hypothetical protein AB9869_09790 [Verrucomicrobiia bacterium]
MDLTEYLKQQKLKAQERLSKQPPRSLEQAMEQYERIKRGSSRNAAKDRKSGK